MQDTQAFILINESVVQFWYAAGVAVALSRVLILPRFVCYCDELWHLSLEVSPQWLCRYPGAVKQILPFHCSADSVLNYPRLDDLPSQHGTAVHYRESTLMDSPKLPQSFKVWSQLQFACHFTSVQQPYGFALHGQLYHL